MDPVRLNISTRGGTINVVAEPGVELTIDGGAIVNEHEGALEVRRTEGAKTILVRCPPGSDITAGTISGKVELSGPLGAVRVATVSGKVRVAEAATVDVRSKSGSVDIGTCAGDCRVIVTSGKIHIGRAQRASIAGVSAAIVMEGVEGADVKTVSGKVIIATTGTGAVNVRTVSGVVEVQVPRDIQPATRLRSISGRVRCDCPTGTDGEIAVKTVSGTIQVSCK